MTLSRSFNNLEKQDYSKMQIQTVENKIERFLERKFRISRSFKTKYTYSACIKKFIEFVGLKYNLDLAQLVTLIDESQNLILQVPMNPMNLTDGLDGDPAITLGSHLFPPFGKQMSPYYPQIMLRERK